MTEIPKQSTNINVSAPTKPHSKQLEVLKDPSRFKVLRAGRKWRKTSLLISWLFEGALLSGKACPYVAPTYKQAKKIAWTDHVSRMLTELKSKKVPYKINEVDLSVTFPHGGSVQLLGVENADSLRGISNWARFAGDEVDDWSEDIWPLIIRPNLITNQAPAIMAGTPKGMSILYRLSLQPEFKEFHYTSYDNPDLPPEELLALEQEYKAMGEDYYRQEILAEYVKPVGLVYKDWDLSHFVDLEYDHNLPLYISWDFGINDPTSILWIQVQGSQFRVIDYYEASDADINNFISVVKSKPYRPAVMHTGDPAGKARELVSGISPIDSLATQGIFVRTKDGVKIPEQIRKTHGIIPSLFISRKCERFRDVLLNYKYPSKKTSVIDQSNEIPVHDQWSHGARALEYFSVNYLPPRPQFTYRGYTEKSNRKYNIYKYANKRVH